MSNAIISRRGGGDYATIKFENYGTLEHSTPVSFKPGKKFVGCSKYRELCCLCRRI